MARRLLFITLTVVLTRWVVAQEAKEPTPELYSKYVQMLGGGLTTASDFPQVVEILLGDGFREIGESSWRYVDEQGIVALMAFPRIGSYHVVFTSKKPTAIGDSALGALIARAESVYVEPGDSLQLQLGTRTRTSNGHTGEIREYLAFKISGGLWWRSSAHIKWPQ